MHQAARDGAIHSGMWEADVKALLPTAQDPIAPVIKSTDNWSFGQLHWPRIDGFESHGYIPGDLYANCLWHHAHPDDHVVDPMASSGMIIKVWREGHHWLDNPEQQISITTADLVPRGPYEGQIQQCDLTQDLPIPKPDYAIIDPPYSGMSQG